MKFSKIILILFFNLTVLALNAQVFTGGNFSFSTSHSEAIFNNPYYSNHSSAFGISISPFAGKFLSEKVAIGIMVNLSGGNSKNVTDHTNLSKDFTLGVHPFVRYYFVQWNKFSLFGVGKTGMNFTQSKNFYDGTKTSKSTGRTFSINVYPGLSYSLSDKIALESEINILSLGYDYYSSKGETLKSHGSEFTLSGSSDIGYISIGAIYKF